MLSLLIACSNSSTDKDSASAKEEGETVSDEAVYSLENDGVDEKKFQEDLEQFPENIPERVITTSVPITEMLQLLDITPVGVPTSTNPIPEEFSEIDQIGSPMESDLEVVTHLEPDLIIGATSLKDTLEDRSEEHTSELQSR